MKIIADISRCCGHARCAAVSETLFVLDDNGYIAITEVAVPAESAMVARRGVRACPERALTLVEEPDQQPRAPHDVTRDPTA